MSYLFGNNNIVTLNQGNEKMYLYNGSTGQFQSAAYGSPLMAESATYHPVCATEDGIIVSTGFGEDVHDHIFYYDSIKGELKSEAGAIMNAGNLNFLFRAFFTDNAKGWAVDTTGIAEVVPFLNKINTIAKDKTNSSRIKQMGYGYKQSLNMYEGGYFVQIQIGYKQNGKGKEQTVNLLWTADIATDENGISISNLFAYDEKPDDGKIGNTERWIEAAPEVLPLIEALTGTFTSAPGANLFNATAGMKLVSANQELQIKAATSIKM
jgi:hypothetical protein